MINNLIISSRRGMILNVIIVISKDISNLSTDYGKGNKRRKTKKRKMLIQQLHQMMMLLLSAMSVLLISHVRMLIG